MATATETVTKATSIYSWQAGPIKLITTPVYDTGATDQFTWMASEMSLVHNCIIRALNSVYLQARHIPTSEHKNFSRYALAIYQCVEAHHHGEETHFFPEVEKFTGKKGLMDDNLAGHRDFEEKFKAWGTWLHNLKDSPKENKFDAETCISMMDAFIPPLSDHLFAEICTLLGLECWGDKLDLRALGRAEGQKVMGGLSKTEQLPALVLNHDPSYERGMHTDFPPVPAAVVWVLREVFGRWQKEWWKFSTVGFDGRPRELAFLGETK